MVVSKKQLLEFIIIFNILYSLLESYFSVSRVLILVPDIILMYFIVTSNKKIIIKRIYRQWYLIAGLLMVIGLISFVINDGSVIMLLWGVRYYFRLYFYFFLCVFYFSASDVENLFGIVFEKLSVFNLGMILFQAATGRYGDEIGGIFGTVSGCNAALNIYVFLQLSYAVSKNLYGKGKLGFLVYSFISAFLVSAIAELKILYFEIAIIFIVAILYSSMKNKMKIILICIIIMPIALSLMERYSANSLQYIFSYKNLIWYNNEIGYGSEDAINRLSAFRIITDKVFRNDMLKQIIGVGLGNANKINFLNKSSAIYSEFRLLRYDWFTHSMVFIEMGWLGVALYEAFYVYSIVFCARRLKTSQSQKMYYFFGVTVAALAILNSIYNNGISTEAAGFMFFFSMATPLIAAKVEEVQS